MKSASNYIAEGWILMTKLTWDDSYFISMMYDGLKDEVKDELARDRNLPTKFTEWVELIININDK